MKLTKGDATRGRILHQATNQASVRGLAGVSLNDVAEAVGISKSGVFKHFDSKESLQQDLLDALIAQFTETIWRPAQHLPRGRARLEMIFERWLDWVDGHIFDGGCPIIAMAVELDDQPGPLRDSIRQSQVTWLEILKAQFRALSDPPGSEDAAELAAFELKGLILSYSESRRLLGDEAAHSKANRAFAALLDRTARAG